MKKALIIPFVMILSFSIWANLSELERKIILENKISEEDYLSYKSIFQDQDVNPDDLAFIIKGISIENLKILDEKCEGKIVLGQLVYFLKKIGRPYKLFQVIEIYKDHSSLPLTLEEIIAFFELGGKAHYVQNFFDDYRVLPLSEINKFLKAGGDLSTAKDIIKAFGRPNIEFDGLVSFFNKAKRRSYWAPIIKDAFKDEIKTLEDTTPFLAYAYSSYTVRNFFGAFESFDLASFTQLLEGGENLQGAATLKEVAPPGLSNEEIIAFVRGKSNKMLSQIKSLRKMDPDVSLQEAQRLIKAGLVPAFVEEIRESFKGINYEDILNIQRELPPYFAPKFASLGRSINSFHRALMDAWNMEISFLEIVEIIKLSERRVELDTLTLLVEEFGEQIDEVTFIEDIKEFLRSGGTLSGMPLYNALYDEKLKLKDVFDFQKRGGNSNLLLKIVPFVENKDDVNGDDLLRLSKMKFDPQYLDFLKAYRIKKSDLDTLMGLIEGEYRFTKVPYHISLNLTLKDLLAGIERGIDFSLLDNLNNDNFDIQIERTKELQRLQFSPYLLNREDIKKLLKVFEEDESLDIPLMQKFLKDGGRVADIVSLKSAFKQNSIEDITQFIWDRKNIRAACYVKKYLNPEIELKDVAELTIDDLAAMMAKFSGGIRPPRGLVLKIISNIVPEDMKNIKKLWGESLSYDQIIEVVKRDGVKRFINLKARYGDSITYERALQLIDMDSDQEMDQELSDKRLREILSVVIEDGLIGPLDKTQIDSLIDKLLSEEMRADERMIVHMVRTFLGAYPVIFSKFEEVLRPSLDHFLYLLSLAQIFNTYSLDELIELRDRLLIVNPNWNFSVGMLEGNNYELSPTFLEKILSKSLKAKEFFEILYRNQKDKALESYLMQNFEHLKGEDLVGILEDELNSSDDQRALIAAKVYTSWFKLQEISDDNFFKIYEILRGKEYIRVNFFTDRDNFKTYLTRLRESSLNDDKLSSSFSFLLAYMRNRQCHCPSASLASLQEIYEQTSFQAHLDKASIFRASDFFYPHGRVVHLVHSYGDISTAPEGPLQDAFMPSIFSNMAQNVGSKYFPFRLQGLESTYKHDRKAISRAKSLVSASDQDLTFVVSGHGSCDLVALATSSNSSEMTISYDEIFKTLRDRSLKYPRSNTTLLLHACYSYDLARNVLKRWQSDKLLKHLKIDPPNILSLSNKNDSAVKSVVYSLYRFSSDGGVNHFNGEDFLDHIDAYNFTLTSDMSYDDPVVFFSPKDKDYQDGGGACLHCGLTDCQTPARYLEIF